MHESNWLKELCNKNKDKLVSTVHINKNVATSSNLDNQKVAPALVVFSLEVTIALRLKFGDEAKGAY